MVYYGVSDPRKFFADPDPGSQKCPYGSGSKGVNTKKKSYTKKGSNKSFIKTLKNYYKLIKKEKYLSNTKGSLLLFFQFCIHLMNLYIS